MIMTPTEKQAIVDKMPIDVKVNLNGIIIDARLTGKKRAFPIVYLTASTIISFEISWSLAKMATAGHVIIG